MATSSSTGISGLPPELLAIITENLDRLRDVSALARANQRLYAVVNPLLYRRGISGAHPDPWPWPLAWAANCGVVGTLRHALAAGANPDYEFITQMPFSEWKEKVTADRHNFAEAGSADDVWDSDNECESVVDWSPENDDSENIAALATYPHTSSNATSDPWGLPYEDSDDDLSDVFMDDDVLSRYSDSDDASSTANESWPYGRRVFPQGRYVVRRFRPIHLAARAGHVGIIDVLLQHHASITAPSERFCDCERPYGLLNATEAPDVTLGRRAPGWSPLHIAICHGKSEAAKALLSHGASPAMEIATAYEEHHLTALHQAASSGLVDVVRYLVDHKIQTDVDVRDSKTLTPFYHAYASRRWDSTVPLLLELGANINVDTKMFIPYSTISPLGEACRLGDFEEADRLIELGADVNHGFIATISGGGLTPLHLCAMPSARPPARESDYLYFNHEPRAPGRARAIAKLVAKGARLYARDCSGDTPLIAAAQHRNVVALQAILKAGADIHETNSMGRNALMQAILGPPRHGRQAHGQYGNIDLLIRTLRELLNRGARLEDKDVLGNTVFHLLFHPGVNKQSATVFAMRLLLSRPGACEVARVRDKNDRSPLHLAFEAENLDACQVLVSRGCSTEDFDHQDFAILLDQAITHGDRFLEFLFDIDVKGFLASNSSIILNKVLESGIVAPFLARVVLDRGLPPPPQEDRVKLLSKAIRLSVAPIVYHLLESGVNVGTQDENGEYPLAILTKGMQWVGQRPHMPYGLEQLRLVHELLSRGASIHDPISVGSRERVLTRVIRCDWESVLRVMLEHQPLAGDPRAVGGCYLHYAVTLSGEQKLTSERGLDVLIASGPDLEELNDNGDTPLSVLLRSLCANRRLTWRYHRFIKALASPKVDINRRNNDGASIADYLQKLLHSKADSRTTFLARRINIVDAGGGRKVLRFLPRPRKFRETPLTL